MTEYEIRFLILGTIGMSFEEAADKIYEECEEECLVGKFRGQFQVDFSIEADSVQECGEKIGKEVTNLIRALGRIVEFQLIWMTPEGMEDIRTDNEIITHIYNKKG